MQKCSEREDASATKEETAFDALKDYAHEMNTCASALVSLMGSELNLSRIALCTTLFYLLILSFICAFLWEAFCAVAAFLAWRASIPTEIVVILWTCAQVIAIGYVWHSLRDAITFVGLPRTYERLSRMTNPSNKSQQEAKDV